MDISWTTVISSLVASGVFSGVFACILGACLQRRNNKELEVYKAEVRKSTDEHQIQFKHWHEEKAKAVKEFYYSAVMWYQEMSAFRAVSQMYVASPTAAIKQRLNIKMERVLQLNESTHRDWTYLRLFLENEELLIADRLFDKGGAVFDDVGSQYQKNSYSLKKETMGRELKEMISIIEELRQKLQGILKAKKVK